MRTYPRLSEDPDYPWLAKARQANIRKSADSRRGTPTLKTQVKELLRTQCVQENSDTPENS